jgi:hypothetical protein
VWYNLASVQLKMRRYEEASTQLAKAIEFLAARDETGSFGVDRRLLASAHQNKAFSLVMRSLERDKPAERVELANESQLEWKRGVDALTRAGISPPANATLTLARIHSARGEWNEALTVLRDLENKGVTDPDVYLLSAAANLCGGQRKAFGDYLAKYKQRLDDSTADAASEFPAGIQVFGALTERCS